MGPGPPVDIAARDRRLLRSTVYVEKRMSSVPKRNLVVTDAEQLEAMIEEAVSRGVRAATRELEVQLSELREQLPTNGKLTHHQVAAWLDVTAETVLRYIKEENLPVVTKLGHNYIIDIEALTDWLEDRSE